MPDGIVCGDAILARALLEYDGETGTFTWKARNPSMFESSSSYSKERRCSKWNTRYAGKVAGANNGYGYVIIGFKGKKTLAHRLAWLWVTGGWPPDQIDHVNCVRSDNRIANLRIATNATNRRNTKAMATSKTGVKGVSPFRGRFRAAIVVGYKQIHLGYFKSIDAAKAAYTDASRKYHGEFGRVA